MTDELTEADFRRVATTLEKRCLKPDENGDYIIPIITSQPMTDSIVTAVIAKYAERSRVGVAKYGVTLDRTDLTLQDWLTHLQEELMDATLYVEKLKQTL